MNKLWYKNAVIYSLDVEAFKDSNKDGVGDFRGLKDRLHYLASLGVNCLWLLPFYDTPNEDNGYDVKDYFQIDRRLGDMGNFSEFLEEADELGMRVITDLVVNHTSDKHYWFQQAREDKNSPYRDFYIWADEKPKNHDEHVMFNEAQGGSNWNYDEKAEAYYYHTFYPHQPDLNLTNPAVQEEIKRIMHFWLRLGVSGFRIDAAPHMIREKGDNKFKGNPHDLFRDFRSFVQEKKQDAILLAEVNVKPERYTDFFGEEDQMNLLLDFYINNYTFLSLARGEATPLKEAFENLPHKSKKEQMANFIRNHDELNLSQLKNSEREEVMNVFAPEENMRLFERGIRRRVAPMMNNDRKKLEFVYSLLFTLPGTPVLRYGQEIGMGEDLSLKGRRSVRTVMQWANTKNGGFSHGPEDNLVRKVIAEGEYGYKKVNVNDQHRDPDSLLNWMGRAINFRKEVPEFGWGEYETIKTGNSKVLAYCRKSEKGTGIAIHNFSGDEVEFNLDIDDTENIVDVFGNEKYDRFNSDSKKIKLSPYGYRWLRKREVYT